MKTQTEAKHTALPIDLINSPNCLKVHVTKKVLLDLRDWIMSVKENEVCKLPLNVFIPDVDAAFIVKACNSHYELVEALQLCQTYMLAGEDSEICGERALIAIKAALAKAGVA